MRDVPFEHKHARTFEFRSEEGSDGTKMGVLDVGTDLTSAGWSQSEAGKDLLVAVNIYICGPCCRVKKVNVFPVR